MSKGILLVLGSISFREMRQKFRAAKHARSSGYDVRSEVARERRRLASDLHDTVGHGLVMIAMQARHLGAASPRLRPQLRQIEEGARESLQEIRRLVGEMHAVDRQDRSLTQAVTSVVRQVPEQALRMTLEVLGEEDRLHGPVKDAALRVVKEGTTNALKYAQGMHATDTLWFSTDLLVSVRSTLPDNRDVLSCVSSEKVGFGLLGLREHVMSRGGWFQHGLTETGEFRISAVFRDVCAVAAEERAAR
jgi:signal transduction histidine kinase